MLFLKSLILFNLGFISFQDLKNREVYWFLFPLLIILLGYLHYSNTSQINFVISSGINLVLIFSIIAILYIYTLLKIKRPFFSEVFGIGDALLFIAIALAFPTITFVIIFVFSIFFSLAVWIILKNTLKHKTIPLAGYISIFMILIYLGDWIIDTVNLYTL